VGVGESAGEEKDMGEFLSEMRGLMGVYESKEI
jgi:hypothetical protein